jgi:hypothetical protein
MAETEAADTTEAAAPAAAEHYSDAHRDNYLRALAEEKRGYDQKAEGADENGGTDDQGTPAATWTKRAAAVQEEIDRVNGDVKAGKKTARVAASPSTRTILSDREADEGGGGAAAPPPAAAGLAARAG